MARRSALRDASRWIERLDARLLALPKEARRAILTVTVLLMIGQALPFVPRDVIDYSRLWPGQPIHQQALLGGDTVADIYQAKVTLNDVRDMYTKRLVAQDPIEAHWWSRQASAPYPPAALLTEAALFALGGRTSAGFYLMILALACVFIGLSMAYFVRTRWYLFPILYANCSYTALRFVGVQDCTYLIMLVAVAVALRFAQRRWQLSHALMALAITVKLSPLFYCTELPRMRRGTAALFVAIVAAGLALPILIWNNYLYIYTFSAGNKGHLSAHLSAPAVALPFAAVLWYVEARRGFDPEDRLGWSLVPFAMFLAVWTNATRHLLLPLFVPDKRGSRNVVAAIGLAAHSLFPSTIPVASILLILIGLLVLVLAGHLHAIGWKTVRHDARHPILTLRALAAPSALGGRYASHQAS